MSLYKILLSPLSNQIRFALQQIAKDKSEVGRFMSDQYVSLAMYRDDIDVQTEVPLIKLKQIMDRLRNGDLHAAAAIRYTQETADRLCRRVDLSELKSPSEHFELWRGQMINLAESLERVGY